jgi:hypothetical protein
LVQGWQKWATGKQPWKDSLETISWQGFGQEGYLKGFSNQPTIFLNDEISSSEVDDSQLEVEGSRNPPKVNLVQNLARKSNPIKEPSHSGFDGGYEITSRCIAFGILVASHYTQSNSITYEQENMIMMSLQSWLWVAVSKLKSGAVWSKI